MLPNGSARTGWHNKLFGLVLLGLALAAHAAPSADRPQAALAAFETACMAQRWAQCHAAWYDLFDAGMTVKTDGSGDDTLDFPGHPEVTKQYGAIAEKLDAPGLRPAWDATVMPLRQTDALPSVLLARLGMFDASMKEAALEIAQQRLTAKKVPYKAHATLKDDRAEWLRYLALVYLARDDQDNARQALAMLEHTPKAKAAYVRRLRLAMNQYFHQ